MIKYKQGNHPNSHKHNTIKNLGGYAKKGIMIGHKAAHYEKLHTKETKLKISLANKGKKSHRKGITLEQEYGKYKSKKIRKQKSVSLKNRYIEGTIINPMKGKKRLDISIKQKGKGNIQNIPEVRLKNRLNVLKYVRKYHEGKSPRIGKNEKRILNEIELSLKNRIIRQYEVYGYFVDGYIKKLNLVIEIDEKPKISKREIRREWEIKKELNCRFIRIKDY